MSVRLTAWPHHHVDVGVDAAILRIRIADLEHAGRACGFVDQVMPVLDATRGNAAQSPARSNSSPLLVTRVSSPSTTQMNSSWLCQ